MNWLSQVIAGKQRPISLDIDSSTGKDARKPGDAEAAHSAATVDVLRRIFPHQHEPAKSGPTPPSAKTEPAPAEPASPEAAPTAAAGASAAVEATTVTNELLSAEPSSPEGLPAGGFSAEDLCGAPVVPLIVATPAASDEITAADVCWVPPGRELHPEPVAEPVVEPVAEATAEPEAVAQPEAAQEAAGEPVAAVPAPEPSGQAVDEVLTRIEASTTAATVEPAAVESAPVESAPEPVAAVTEQPEAAPEAAEAAPEAASAETTQTEAEPQEAAASSPENAFADANMWRGVAELAARQKRTNHHETSETIAETGAETGADAEAEPLPAELAELSEAQAAQPENWAAAIKALTRLNSAMPWLTRANGLEAGTTIEPAMMPEVRDEVAGMRLVQYEIKTAVQDHSLQLKRMEENLARVRDTLQATASEDVTENVKSTAKAVRMMMIGMGATVVLILIMIGMLLAHGH